MFYNEKVEDILKKLGTFKVGLSDKEANDRLIKNGKNVLPRAKQDSVFKIFFDELQDPIIMLLIVAIIASFITGEVIDAIAIMFIVFIDVIMGTYQENKANNTAQALSKLVTVKSKVLRGGNIKIIDSMDLVVGDVVILESGDKVSADMRLFETYSLTVDEAILTGESIQVEKYSDVISRDNLGIADRKNMLFSGTTVVSGRGKGIVIGVGVNTEIGRIADTIQNTKEEKSPLTIRVEKLSKQISVLVLIIAFIITFLLISKGEDMHSIFLSVVALAVSAMPEGLPLALTMALTIASNKMAKKNVVAKKLHSVESLGSCTVIASDKTGTLTVNEQTAKRIILPNNVSYEITGTGYELEGEVIGDDLSYARDIALCGVLNNEASIDKDSRIGDSIDIAFLVLGKKLEVESSDIKILERIPYESQNKYSAVFYEKDSEVYCTVKGSLEKVLSFCNKANLVSELDIEQLKKQNETLASDGYRVIAVADGKVSLKDNYSNKDIENLTFMGMVGFIDPIRKEVVSSIKECKSAGIKVLMITGDHPLTAFSIAKELELTDNYDEVTNGEEVDKYLKMNPDEFDKFVSSKCIFTRVSPMQKLEIVESLKRRGEFVAVTGDGVNDAPALKVANIGVAMGSGTDIARETSKMIIMDDNFKSIVAGVKEGRVAYANIRKIIFFLISCGMAEVLFFCLSIIFDLPMPLVAIQLLWINVVTDGIQDFALSFEKAEDNIMEEKPRNPEESLFDKSLLREILVSGSIIGILVFVCWYYLINVVGMEVELARGYIMALMVFIQNIHVFNCRSEKNSAFCVPLANNPLIVGGVVISIILQIIVMESSLFSTFLQTSSIPFIHLIILFLLAFVVLICMELYKLIVNKIKRI